MSQISFLHTADLHLDAAFSSLGDETKAEARRNELEYCFDRITKKVLDESIDLLIISGDFFEQSTVRGSTILKIKNRFTELYNTEILIAPGNHDPLTSNSYYKSTNWGSNVHILEDSRQVLYLEKCNAYIYCLGIKNSLREDLTRIKAQGTSKEGLNILLFHGTIDIPFEEGNYNSISSKELLSLGMDYVALGHMHNHIIYQNENTVMINPGSPEPLGFDEEGQHGYVQGFLSVDDNISKKVNFQYISSAIRHYHNFEVNINGCSSDEEVVETLRRQEQFSLKGSDLYSITLTGFIKKDYIPNFRSILGAFETSCFLLKLKNNTSAEFEYEQYLEDPGIKGEFVRKIMDMQQEETSIERLETLFMALQYGLQALENGRIEQ